MKEALIPLLRDYAKVKWAFVGMIIQQPVKFYETGMNGLTYPLIHTVLKNT